MGEESYKMEIQSGVVMISFETGTEMTPELIIEVIRREKKFQGVDAMNALWDFRGCLPSEDFGYDAIERIINFVANYPEIQWNPRLAILAEAGVQYGLSRMYQTLVNQFPTEIGIFDERGKAMIWVGGEDAENCPEKGRGEITN